MRFHQAGLSLMSPDLGNWCQETHTQKADGLLQGPGLPWRGAQGFTHVLPCHSWCQEDWHRTTRARRDTRLMASEAGDLLSLASSHGLARLCEAWQCSNSLAGRPAPTNQAEAVTVSIHCQRPPQQDVSLGFSSYSTRLCHGGKQRDQLGEQREQWSEDRHSFRRPQNLGSLLDQNLCDFAFLSRGFACLLAFYLPCVINL